MTAALTFILLVSLSGQVFSQDTVEVTSVDKDAISQELEKEAANPKNDSKTKRMLQKVAKIFKNSKNSEEVEVVNNGDCVDCQKQANRPGAIKRIGRGIGKASAWLATTTAKPFMNASGFLTATFENKNKNPQTADLYKFFLNHQKEFDSIYLEAGTPIDMIDLMIIQTEEIMENKSRLILKDILASFGLTTEIPEDMSEFRLSGPELAQIDFSKLDPDMVNNHPEYAEVRSLLGDLTKENLIDIIQSGYFDKTVSFENMKEGLPKAHELVSTIVAQVFAPKLVLGAVSSSLAHLYAAPVMAAQVGTGISAAVCLNESTQNKFDEDQDLMAFCSYVTNRTSYELVKSRAKGYVAGKNIRAKLNKKRAERKERRALKGLAKNN